MKEDRLNKKSLLIISFVLNLIIVFMFVLGILNILNDDSFFSVFFISPMISIISLTCSIFSIYKSDKKNWRYYLNLIFSIIVFIVHWIFLLLSRMAINSMGGSL